MITKYILEKETIGYIDGLDVGVKEKEVFVLSNLLRWERRVVEGGN